MCKYQLDVSNDTLSNIGNILMSKGKCKEATFYHQTAIQIYKELGSRRFAAISIFNLAIAYEEGEIIPSLLLWKKPLLPSVKNWRRKCWYHTRPDQ